MEIEWTETALADMADLDKGIARRVKQSVALRRTGAGNVNASRTSTLPSSASVSATTASASIRTTTPCASCASATAARPTAEAVLAAVKQALQIVQHGSGSREAASLEMGSPCSTILYVPLPAFVALPRRSRWNFRARL
jgi:hypothetical protein